MASTRIGIVGAGAITQLAHLPVLSRMRGVKVTALCDNDLPKARALADRFEVPDTFTDMEDMLGYGEMDAVVIATPNHLHEPHVLSALASGLDVLCERPLSLTARGVERVLAAAQRKDRKVLVGSNARFRNDVQALGGFLRGGELGRISGVRAGIYQLRGTITGWRQRRNEAGGALLDAGLPLLDLALWMVELKPPLRISAHMDRGKGANAVDDALVATVSSADGITLVLDINRAYVGEVERWWFEVIGTRGSARLSPLRVVKELNGRPMDVSPSGAAARDSAFVQSYRASLAHFLAVVRGEAEYEPPVELVLLHRVLEAIYRSAEEGKEVTLAG